MRREERAAAIDVVQMLDRGPGDREAVEGRGAAADLVEDDQRPRPAWLRIAAGLDHLDHEGRAAARQIVGGADAAEQPVDDADMRALGRHEGADLREDGDQRVLPQEGALAGHVGAGQQPQPLARPPRSQSLATKRAACSRAQRRLDDRMAAAVDREAGAVVDRRAGT